MKKWTKIFLFIILTITIISVILAFIFLKPYFTLDPGAILNIENGKVELNKGSKWEIATNGTQLREGWDIKTNDETEAEIIFFGGSVARFNENSEIKLKEIDEKEKNVYIEQLGGDIWYNTLDGSGISFLIETPEGIFTNEGTIFRVTTTPSAGVITAAKTLGATKISVARGFIKMSSKVPTPVKQQTTSKARTLIDSIRNDTNRYILLLNMTATIKQNRHPTFTPLVPDEWAKKNKAEDDRFVVRRREQLKKKYNSYIQLAKLAYPELFTDELINGYIDDVLQGKIDITQKIQDGTIPKEYVRLIPPELISAKPTPVSTENVSTEKKVVKTSISSVLPAKLGINSSLAPEERLVPTGEDQEMKEVDLYISGQNFSADSQVMFFPGTGMGVSYVRVVDSENIVATVNIEKNAIQTGPKAVLLFDKNSPTAQAKLNSAVNVQASLSRDEELKLDGVVLKNKWNAYLKFKSAGKIQQAADRMLSIMRELDVLPQTARGACDESSSALIFGLEHAIVAGAEGITRITIPIGTINVLRELYATLGNLFDPKAGLGKATLSNKLTYRGVSLEESMDIINEIERVYNNLGPLLRG